MARHHKRGKHWARDALSTRTNPIRKGKAKLSTVGQRYDVAPVIFDPLVPSVDSPIADEDRKHHSTTFAHVKNGVEQGSFDVPRRVSGSGVILLPTGRYWDDVTGKWIDTYDGDNGVIEIARLNTKAVTTYIGFVCPKCGSTHYIHNCESEVK